MDHTSALLAESDAFADLVEGADWSAPVPTCPGWSLLQLVKHLGRGHRWSAQIVAERRDAPLDPREVTDGRPPDDAAGAAAWLRASAPLVVEAVRAVGPDTPVWTFTGPRPAAWWIRRRLHESAVHRADAALALGAAYAADEAVAADGVAEWLELMAARPREADGTGPLEIGRTLALVADDAAAWVARGTEDGIAVEAGTGPADAVVSGPAADLLLAVSRRGGEVRVGGAPEVWRGWLDRTGF